MNDNHIYVVKCTSDNFDEAQAHLQMYAQVVEIDSENCCIRTFSLCGTIKQRLSDIGASFWQESGYTAAKSVAARKA